MRIFTRTFLRVSAITAAVVLAGCAGLVVVDVIKGMRQS